MRLIKENKAASALVAAVLTVGSALGFVSLPTTQAATEIAALTVEVEALADRIETVEYRMVGIGDDVSYIRGRIDAPRQ